MMKATNFRAANAIKTMLIGSIIGICPCVAIAATPQELLTQCKAEIDKDSHADKTAQFCLNAEKTIQSANANSKEHVKILEQLGLLASYNNSIKSQQKNFYTQALEAAKHGFGDQSPETFESLANLGAIAKSEKNWRESREMYQQLVSAMKKQNSGTVSKREGNALDSITDTYRMEEKASPQTYKIADHLQAEKNYLEALRKMKLDSFEKNYVGSTLLEIGLLEMKQGQLDQAKKDTEAALAVFKENKAAGYVDMAEKQLQKIQSTK